MAGLIKQILFSRSPSPSPFSSRTSFDIDAEQTAFLSKSDSVEKPTKGAQSNLRVDARIISDAIIGLSDGLTVPFALTAGLSALGDTQLVIYGGLAELIAGSISMGLGGYLGAKSEAESYGAMEADTRRKMLMRPDEIMRDVKGTLEHIGLPNELADQVTTSLLSGSEERLLYFLMRQQQGLPEPPSNRAFTCALTIALGYFVGGVIPLLPYCFVAQEAVRTGLVWSACVMVITLFAFGYAKTSVVYGWSGCNGPWKAMKGGGEMVVVGSIAASAAMGLVILFSKREGQGV